MKTENISKEVRGLVTEISIAPNPNTPRGVNDIRLLRLIFLRVGKSFMLKQQRVGKTYFLTHMLRVLISKEANEIVSKEESIEVKMNFLKKVISAKHHHLLFDSFGKINEQFINSSLIYFSRETILLDINFSFFQEKLLDGAFQEFFKEVTPTITKRNIETALILRVLNLIENVNHVSNRERFLLSQIFMYGLNSSRFSNVIDPKFNGLGALSLRKTRTTQRAVGVLNSSQKYSLGSSESFLFLNELLSAVLKQEVDIQSYLGVNHDCPKCVKKERYQELMQILETCIIESCNS